MDRDPDQGHVIGTNGPDLVLNVMEPGETYATSEIVDAITTDVTRRSVLNWLHRLNDDGRVEMRRVNDQLILWSLSNEN